MSGPAKINEFPDISNKLSAPSKKPLFERQKAEAEAKRQRDEAETAAVYRDFVKSFDDDEDDGDGFPKSRTSDTPGRGFGQIGPRATFGGASKRHFTPSNLKSGPGSLGPVASSAFKNRISDGRPINKGHGGFTQDDYNRTGDAKSAFQKADEEEEDNQSSEDRIAPKPTIHLSSLIPGTSLIAIKALFSSNLQVDNVRLLPPPQGGMSTERRSVSAIVTLAKDTPASDIDAAVNSLQNTYLGQGFKLSISRHLSSAVLRSASISTGLSSAASLPFGAVPAQLPSVVGSGFGRGQPSHRGGYAPPSSYTPQTQLRGANASTPSQVVVKPPSDIKELKLIHKTLEAVLTHGPEFEALLMTRPDVQREEKWLWLWDARSPGGIWYRWRLWEMLSGQSSRRSGTHRGKKLPYSLLFDTGAPWQSPDSELKFEFTTEFEDFISDPDYDSSDEEEDGEDINQRGGATNALSGTTTAEYLNPLQKAKLTHLLSRLPSTTARLRKGDVARVTAFAITHAGRGSEEVVNMLLDNVERPFIYASSNPVKRPDDAKRPSSPQVSDAEAEDDLKQGKPDKEDVSSSTLIALYVISDLLSCSSTSGARNAWRYRQLFEVELASRKIFTRLGNMERDLNWGRLRAEKWRRAVTQLLQMWEGWCVFGSSTHESFVKAFELACEGEKKAEKAKATPGVEAASRLKKKTAAWKTVDDKTGGHVAEEENIDGEAMDEDDVDGEPMKEDDIDGEPMEEDDVDGDPMEEMQSSNEESAIFGNEALDAHGTENGIESGAPLGGQQTAHGVPGKRKRPTAAEMFAAESD